MGLVEVVSVLPVLLRGLASARVETANVLSTSESTGRSLISVRGYVGLWDPRTVPRTRWHDCVFDLVTSRAMRLIS